MNVVRWGIIGVGDVTERKSGPGFQQAERSELVAVMRRDGAKAANFASRHGVPRWYSDADELINDPSVDAVYIATPPDSHRDYAIRVAEAGKPVYVEKPMARTAAECVEMIDACAAAGVRLFVAYYRRAMPRFLMIKKLIDDGALGSIRSAVVRNQRPAVPVGEDGVPWRVRPEISGGGHFVDLGSHALDLLDWLIAPIAEISGRAVNLGRRYPAEDLVTASFSFSCGAQGTGLWCYDAAEYQDEIELIGTAGTLRFSVFGQESIRLSTGSAEREFAAPYPPTVQLPLIQTIVDELTGRGTAPSTGVSALRTAQAIDSVLADYRAGVGQPANGVLS